MFPHSTGCNLAKPTLLSKMQNLSLKEAPSGFQNICLNAGSQRLQEILLQPSTRQLTGCPKATSPLHLHPERPEVCQAHPCSSAVLLYLPEPPLTTVRHAHTLRNSEGKATRPSFADTRHHGYGKK